MDDVGPPPNPIRFGYELEFAYAGDPALLAIPPGWQIEREQSAAFHSLAMGYEIRNERRLHDFPMDDFRAIVAVLVEHNAFVHKTCGFHIHISGVGDLDVQAISEKLSRVHHHKARDYWLCGELLRDKKTTHYPEHYKYGPFRKIHFLKTATGCIPDECDDHYEARVYNATLNIRGLHHAYLNLLRSIGVSPPLPRVVG